ncbi:hypothetical protein [Eubacterium barkeri]|uniref:Uncharacterized protein n=1 Tax=Eubacterium barkeri TaxID=1528 RepID=A0A1H3HCR9_EUBBA|nr:hypothetical protein [Eubacterium barkeri]SDY13261.1 hypothetical protein SAMN04488579_11745 [Eubacterium barkeri]
MPQPLPFPDFLLNTSVRIVQSTINEDGESSEILLYDGKAIYDEKSRSVLDAQRRLVTLSGKIIAKGDIYPGQLLEGYVEVGPDKKFIYNAARIRNPDGSVFSTELDLSG